MNIAWKEIVETVSITDWTGNKRTLALYPNWKSCRCHIQKHVFEQNEPWRFILKEEPKKYINCQTEVKNIVKLYRRLCPEFRRALWFAFLGHYYLYFKNFYQNGVNLGTRVYGVSPLGLFLVVNEKSMLTAFFPFSEVKCPSSPKKRFETGIEFMIIKARKYSRNRLNEDSLKPKYLFFPSHFGNFLKAYQNVEKEEEMKRILEKYGVQNTKTS